MDNLDYQAVVVGASAGGLKALQTLLCGLPKGFTASIVVVQHIAASSQGLLASLMSSRCDVVAKEADDKERLQPGVVYFAPPNYHLLVETDRSLSLSSDERENYSRPSIDVLFESAADAFGKSLIAILLTGASCDGAAGLKRVKEAGGLAIVQDPNSAEYATMPEAGLRATAVDQVLPLEMIAPFLNEKLPRWKEAPL